MALSLDESGGLTALEKLQAHYNSRIYQKAVNLIEVYFGFEEEEMADDA